MNLLQRWLLTPKQKELIKSLEQKSIPIPTAPQYQFNPIKGGFVIAKVQNTKKYIDEAFNINSTVYSIISTASEKFGSIPWILYKVKDQKKAKEYDLLSKGYTGTPAHLTKLMNLKAQAFDEVEQETDLMNLWDNPNDQITGADFRAFACMFKMLTGAGTMWLNKGLSGVKPLEMFILPTQFITLYPDNTLNKPAKITYDISGAQVELNMDDVLYWKYNNPNFDLTGSHLYGQAPLRAAGIEVDADNQNVLAQKFMFENAGVTGLWTPKTLTDADALNNYPGGVDAARQTLTDLQRREPQTDRRPYFNVPSEYHSYGMDSKEMDLVSARRLSKEFIANVFNFPPALLSLERATDNNFDAAVKYVVTNTIYANLCSYRDRNNNWLVPQFGYKKGQAYLDFDLSSLPELQGDFQKMVDSLSKMDWITYDEKREAMKYDAKGGAYATSYLNSGLKPIDQVFEGMDEPIDPSIL